MEYREITAADIIDMKNGDMRNVKIDENNEVLLCKIDNNFYAVNAHCPHYGAPLADGILSGNTIICPWHHSCFNAMNGDLLEPPSLNPLNSFEIRIEGSNVIIKVPVNFSQSREPKLTSQDADSDTRTFIIIGAGAAGNAAAESLRENGFKGNLIMITYENRLPYDRPNLSKAYLSGEAPSEWMPLRPENFYKDSDIRIMLNKKVTGADVVKKEITFEDGSCLSFDKLLIASGGSPVKLNLPGNDLKNLFYLRSFDSCEEIIQAGKNSEKVVVIGSSFIGMESAISLKERYKNLSVTIITKDEVPFEKVFGKETGSLFKEFHEEHGIKFITNSGVSEFKGNDKIESVVLENGEVLDADMVIAGIGVKPATDFIHGLNLEKDGSIKVDSHLKVNDDIYAAGDVAMFPDWRTGNFTRIEHWRTAEQQGRIAGINLAGKKIEYKSVPFFWTRQGDFGLDYVGHAADWDEIFIDGNLKEKDFIAYFIKENKILAAAGTKSKELAAINALMKENKMPSADEIKSSGVIELI